MTNLLIGGSPCTHWSIAQTKSRETQPSGIGWELFENYLYALDKHHADFFLYENNKSMSAAIREEITKRLGVEPICINSALVSAQTRQRLYWTNIPGVQQPEDRGILLRDILETGVAWREKGYTLRASIGQHGGVSSVLKTIKEPGKFSFNGVAEPVSLSWRGRGESSQFEARGDGKSGSLTAAGHQNRYVSEPVRVGDMPNKDGKIKNRQSGRIYSVNGKSVSIQARPNGGGADGATTGLYAVPCAGRMVGRRINEEGHRDDYNVDIERFQRFELNENPQKTNCLTTVSKDNLVIQRPDAKASRVHQVKDGFICIRGKWYPIKLADGYYIIRKLTVRECMRLQTVPEWYVFPVSDTQAYKMLGNGWTVDVISHIMSYCHSIFTDELDVLSMYDGMACGHIALNNLGAHIARYRATEIDKYAIKTACHNFPDIIQLGDAFQVREW